MLPRIADDMGDTNMHLRLIIQAWSDAACMVVFETHASVGPRLRLFTGGSSRPTGCLNTVCAVDNKLEPARSLITVGHAGAGIVY